MASREVPIRKSDSLEIWPYFPEIFRRLPIAYGETIRNIHSDNPLSGNTSHNPDGLQATFNSLKQDEDGAAEWIRCEQLRATKRLEALHQRLIGGCALAGSIINSKPTHSTVARRIDMPRETTKFAHTTPYAERHIADAVSTNLPHTPLVFNPADCPIINLAEVTRGRNVSRIGQIHAGVRGIHDGIIGKSIPSLGFTPQHTVAFISPHARGFTLRGAWRDELGARLTPYLTQEGDEWPVDLTRAVIDQLTEAGIPERNIETSPHDSMRSPYYFSQRLQDDGRAGSPFGRNAMMLVKLEE